MNEQIIGTYQPAEDYLHPEMRPIVDRLFEEGLTVEAHEVMAISIDYAQRLKYAAALVGHQITALEVAE